MAPLAPLSTPVVARKKKEQHLLDAQIFVRLTKSSQKHKTLQNEKHYCQYRMLRLVVTNWIVHKRRWFVEAL